MYKIEHTYEERYKVLSSKFTDRFVAFDIEFSGSLSDCVAWITAKENNLFL